MSRPKERVRLYAAGQTMYRLVTPDRGWGGRYGQDRRPAKWACIHCGSMIWGDDEKPWQWLLTDTIGFGDHTETRWLTKCARNGHAPCAHCGQPLPRTNDGCPRAHNWRTCPAKTEAHRMIQQHSAAGHQDRCRP